MITRYLNYKGTFCLLC